MSEKNVISIKQPLGLYDFFGYLFPGLFFLFLLIIDLDGSKVLRYFLIEKKTEGMLDQGYDFKINYLLDFIYFKPGFGSGIVTFLIFLFFCYVTGHIVAAFSSFLSKQFVKRFLKYPTDNLFPIFNKKDDRNKVYKAASVTYHWLIERSNFLFRLNYKRTFDENFRMEFKKRVDEFFQYNVKTRDYYWLIYTYICSERPQLVRRIQHFVNLFGFARNLAGSIFLYLLVRIFIFNWYLGFLFDEAAQIIFFTYVVILFIMFWSYLRLYKRQAVDMFYLFYNDVCSKNQ